MHRWWNSLWNMCLPPKVRVFVWRAYHNALPSLESLWKRTIVDLPRCSRCKANGESSTHSPFDCKAARKSGRELALAICWLRSEISLFWMSIKCLLPRRPGWYRGF
ncbi:hypothetical protein Dsin_025201 [Dipteronia sinensis]|uniref:Reverse transcriptase zinc-binding domain-containing protein n=1 Tax=Dipteronia sinensis TaxID=43782 RepID=A0AAE0DWW1_9ROSI|nr:hypothetical protein Dsin_025201 [Dipteronia sinensis]